MIWCKIPCKINIKHVNRFSEYFHDLYGKKNINKNFASIYKYTFQNL